MDLRRGIKYHPVLSKFGTVPGLLQDSNGPTRPGRAQLRPATVRVQPGVTAIRPAAPLAALFYKRHNIMELSCAKYEVWAMMVMTKGFIL